MRNLLPLLVVACATPLSVADVLVVNRTGPGDYTDIQPAIDAAAEGDTILVRSNASSLAYSAFTIDGKSLSLVGPERPEATEQGFVRNLSVDQSVHISGLRIRGLNLNDNQGTVFVENCHLDAHAIPNRNGATVETSAAVTLVDCAVEGSTGEWGSPPGAPSTPGGPGGSGLEIRQSRVAVYGGRVEAGEGGGAYDRRAGDGGPGVHLASGELLLSGTRVAGGAGGDGDIFSGARPGDGGAAIVVGQGASATRRGTTLGGGEGGAKGGQDAPPAIGSVSQLPGDGTPTLVPTTALQGEELLLRLSAAPGRAVVWFAGRAEGWRASPGQLGVFHVEPALQRVATGIVPACGELILAADLPALPTTRPAHVIQAMLLGPGPPELTAPASVTPLDAVGQDGCGRTLFVDADAAPGGDGQSWATAFNDLQDAIVRVRVCVEDPTEIWIAEGTYRPAPPAGPRSRSFLLRSGTHLYGGFEGGELRRRERDPERNRVVLSGDLAQNDGPGGMGENAYHVVRVGDVQYGQRASSVLLDGLTIERGHADGSSFDVGGAGVLAFGGVELRDCIVRDCVSTGTGPALRFWGGRLDVVGCRVFGNRTGTTFAADGRVSGIAAFPDPGGVVRIVNTALHANAGGAALGVKALESSPPLPATARVRHVTITGNRHDDGHAGLRCEDVRLTLENSILWGNVGSPGLSLRDQQYAQLGPRPAETAYLCLQGLTPGFPGPGHTARDPLFVDPMGPDGIPGTLDDDLRLGFGSPCVDAGSNARVACDSSDRDHDGDRNEAVLTDRAGKRRFRDDPAAPDTGDRVAPIVDIGARERTP